jgi:EAL domain-containing protein (putative c-di-GMP-specific phosphodiesterase class I)
MAHALGMTVVGEGIETDSQLDSLVALECDEGQGYVFAPPLAPAELVALRSTEGRATAAATASRKHADGVGTH